jgi:hypothetical protein
MRSTSARIRRGLLLAIVASAIALVVARLRAPAGGRTDIVPTIGGDTWPPVPIKDAGAA